MKKLKTSQSTKVQRTIDLSIFPADRRQKSIAAESPVRFILNKCIFPNCVPLNTYDMRLPRPA